MDNIAIGVNALCCLLPFAFLILLIRGCKLVRPDALIVTTKGDNHVLRFVFQGQVATRHKSQKAMHFAHLLAL